LGGGGVGGDGEHGERVTTFTKDLEKTNEKSTDQSKYLNIYQNLVVVDNVPLLKREKSEDEDEERRRR